MLLEKTLEFADALTLGAPNNNILNVGDVIDLGLARDIAHGEPMSVVIQITTKPTSGGAASISFRVVSDSSAVPSTDETTTRHGATDTILVTTLVIGYQLVIPLAIENPAYERYLGFQVEETAGQALTAGAVNAFLVPTAHVGKWVSYPDASN